MSKKCTSFWREAHFDIKIYRAHQVRIIFRKKKIEKMDAVGIYNTFRSQNIKKTPYSRHFRTFRYHLAWQAQGIMHLLKTYPRMTAGAVYLKRICKDAFRVASAVQKTCSSEMLGGQGLDFMRGVAFWSIRSVDLLR